MEIFRNRERDRIKAREYLAQQAEASFRELMKDYDAFVPHMESVRDPSLVIGTARDSVGTEVPVRLGMKEISGHWLIQGSTGCGKTSFVTSVMSQILSKGYPVGVIDCKSGFFESAIRWAGAAAYNMGATERDAFVQSLAVVNPFSDYLIPFNVCRQLPGLSPEIQAYEIGLVLERFFDSSLSLQMQNLLRHLLALLIEANLSLVEAPDVLHDELLRGMLVQRSQNSAIKEFFLRTYPLVPESSKSALMTRLQSLLLPQNIRLMVGAEDMIDLKSLLDRGNPLFVFLGKGPGVPEEQVDIIGSLFLQSLFQATFSGDGRRRPYQVFMDEFFHLIESPGLYRRFETALTTSRSFGLTIGWIMHNFSQIPSSLRETMLANCDIMAIFRTSSSNAQFFGDFLPEIDPEIVEESLRTSGEAPRAREIRAKLIERLQRLPNRHLYWYDRRKPYRAIRVRVSDLPEPHEAIGISERELDEFIDANGIMRGGVALSKDVLRQQIEARRKRLMELIRPPIRVSESSEACPEAETGNTSEKGKSRKPRIG